MIPCHVTLLVCTRNGARTIEKCLQHCVAEIQRIGSPTAEVVVVDNGSTDRTCAIVEDISREHRSVIRHLHAETPGKNHAFKAGVLAAHSDIIVIVDDDNYLSPGYLSHVTDFFCDYPLVAAIGSSNRLDGSVAAPAWFAWAKDHLACARPFIAENVTVDQHGREVGDVGFIAGAGMAFRRQPVIDAWNAGYRFFSNTDRAARITGEDIELCFLLRSMGYRFGFDPRMQVTHDIAAARLTPAAFRELCEMIGAGSLGIEPFCFTTKREKPGIPWKWHWCWQLMAKLKRWVTACIAAGPPGMSHDEHEFRRRRERHQAWGALRHLFLHPARYTDHVKQVTSGPWTRLRSR